MGKSSLKSPKENFQVTSPRALPEAAGRPAPTRLVTGCAWGTLRHPTPVITPASSGHRFWTGLPLPPSRPAKPGINRTGSRGSRPGTSALSRVRQPPHLSLKAHSWATCGRLRHAAAPASPCRNPRGRAEWEAPLPGGKFCAGLSFNPRCAAALSPLRHTGLCVHCEPRAGLCTVVSGGASPGALGLGRQQPHKWALTAQRQNWPARLHAGGGA